MSNELKKETSKKQKAKSMFFILSGLFYAFGLFVIVFFGVIYREIFLKDYTTISAWLGALLVCALGIEKGLTNRRKQVVSTFEVTFVVFVIMIITILLWFSVSGK
ncbi:MAG: hypothetical protein GX130_07630 [Candidatus Hydrogenedens sp.]|jgi:VIT1/CCC1 family predicted Fe2+/Mn2+ transporter|nr:hypothetical protein [Candidatus Hydrogenedens sp.]